MNHRRQFLKEAAAAGVVFTGCSLLPSRSTAQAQARRQVMVGGRRIRTIDIHAHVVVPEATQLLGVTTAPTDASVMGPSQTPVRFKTMDRWGTDMQALSINPTWYAAEPDVAAQVIKIQNEALAALCAKYPDRFVAFASVALQFSDLAAEQLSGRRREEIQPARRRDRRPREWR